MSPTPRKRRGERFVSRPGDSVFVEPGEQPRQPGARAGPLELAELRRARNITQSQLADTMGVDQSVVSRLESRGDFRMSTVLEYLRALGVNDVELTVKFDDGSTAVLEVAAAGQTSQGD